jgi:hypothetical protein
MLSMDTLRLSTIRSRFAKVVPSYDEQQPDVRERACRIVSRQAPKKDKRQSVPRPIHVPFLHGSILPPVKMLSFRTQSPQWLRSRMVENLFSTRFCICCAGPSGLKAQFVLISDKQHVNPLTFEGRCAACRSLQPRMYGHKRACTMMSFRRMCSLDRAGIR